jgi:hypothetical protein
MRQSNDPRSSHLPKWNAIPNGSQQSTNLTKLSHQTDEQKSSIPSKHTQSPFLPTQEPVPQLNEPQIVQAPVRELTLAEIKANIAKLINEKTANTKLMDQTDEQNNIDPAN